MEWVYSAHITNSLALAILACEKQYEKLELLNTVDEKLLWDLVEFLHPLHTATVQVSRDNLAHAFAFEVSL